MFAEVAWRGDTINRIRYFPAWPPALQRWQQVLLRRWWVPCWQKACIRNVHNSSIHMGLAGAPKVQTRVQPPGLLRAGSASCTVAVDPG